VTLTSGLPAASVVAVIVTKDVQDLSGNALTDFASVFTTAVATDTTRPSVVTRFPGSGTSNVLPSTSIVLYTSEVMNEGSLAPAMHVAQNGQLVAGTISLSAGGQAIVFRPLQPWAAGALVEMYLDSNARDVNGNPLNAFQSSFRVEPSQLATAPQVVAFDNTNRPTNPVLDLAFSQALDASTVNGTTVTLKQYTTGQVVASTVTLIKGGRVIHVVPQSPLVTNQPYHYVQLVGGASGIKNTNGQALSGSPQYYFTVPAGAVADTVAPKVVAIGPPDGSTNVGINGHVHVRFDEPVNPISLYPDQPETTYGSLLWSDGNRSVEFARHEPYAPNTLITESVALIQDLGGNGVAAPNSVAFRTGSRPDFTDPTIEDGTPFNGATNVPVNAVVKLRFSEPVDPASLNSGSMYLSSQDGTIVGTAALEADGRTIAYVPTQALAGGRTFTVYAYPVTDLSGNVAYLYRQFSTGFAADVLGPVVLATSIGDAAVGIPTNAAIQVRFDEAVNEQTIGGIQLTLGGAPVVADRDVSADHTTVTLKLKQPLIPNAGYAFVISGVRDLSGNVLGASRTVAFTTGTGLDVQEPVQAARAPVNGATNVPLNPVIEARFNERINPISLSDTSVRLYDSSTGQFVAGTPSVSADGLTVRFTPAAALAPSRLYYFYTTYNTYVEDLAYNRFNQSTTFTTGVQ
jgi:hypothetical protein